MFSNELIMQFWKTFENQLSSSWDCVCVEVCGRGVRLCVFLDVNITWHTKLKFSSRHFNLIALQKSYHLCAGELRIELPWCCINTSLLTGYCMKELFIVCSYNLICTSSSQGNNIVSIEFFWNWDLHLLTAKWTTKPAVLW